MLLTGQWRRGRVPADGVSVTHSPSFQARPRFQVVRSHQVLPEEQTELLVKLMVYSF